MKKCDIIIPVWNELGSTRECINKLKNHTRYPYRPIVIDNGSLEPTREYLESLKGIFPDILLIRNNSNLGFVKAVNQALVSSGNPYVCILNNDAYVTDNWLTFLIETVESGPEKIGVANPTSNVFGKTACDGERLQWQELDSCKGFCMLIKREVIARIGLFDEVYGIGYFEEKDFCRRALEAGYMCIRAKSSFVIHKDKLSFDKIKERDEIFRRNEHIYNRKWGRPINIAFIVKREDDLKGRENLLYELLQKGHRINIFSAKRDFIAGLKDHIQIRFVSTGNPLLNYRVLFKLWERYNKKRVEVVIARDDRDLEFFNRFKFVHRADVLSGNDNAIKDHCNAKSRVGL